MHNNRKQTHGLAVVMSWLCLIWLGAVVPAAAYNGLVLLNNIEEQAGQKETVIRFHFNGSVSANPSPVYSDRSIQLDIPGVYIHPAKKSFTTHDERIVEIFAAQYRPDVVRVRFVLAEGARLHPGDFKLNRKGGLWSINLPAAKTAAKAKAEPVAHKAEAVAVDHKPTPPSENDDVLEQLLARVAERRKSEVKKEKATEGVTATRSEEESKPERSEPESSRIVEKDVTTENDAVSPAPTSPVKAESKNLFRPENKTVPAAPAAETPSLLASGFKMLYTLFFVLGLMFLVFFVFKKTVLKNSLMGGNGQWVQVLSTGFLGPRRSVALVDVAGEILVLGMTGENITLLTRIRDAEKIKKIREGRPANVLDQWLSRTSGSGAAEDELQLETGEPRREEPAAPFTRYVKSFAAPEKSSITTVADVTAMIRKNLNKVKSA